MLLQSRLYSQTDGFEKEGKRTVEKVAEVSEVQREEPRWPEEVENRRRESTRTVVWRSAFGEDKRGEVIGGCRRVVVSLLAGIGFLLVGLWAGAFGVREDTLVTVWRK